jgi:hypothetical protein
MKNLKKKGKNKKSDFSKSFALTSAIVLSHSITEKKRMNTYDKGNGK